MKNFSFKALIVFIIVLVSGLILLPILTPDTDNVGGNGGNYELLVDNELMTYYEFDGGYGLNFDNRDYKIILVSFYSLSLKAVIVENMILNEESTLDKLQLLNIPNIQALGLYGDNHIGISTEYIGDLNITVWGVSK